MARVVGYGTGGSAAGGWALAGVPRRWLVVLVMLLTLTAVPPGLAGSRPTRRFAVVTVQAGGSSPRSLVGRAARDSSPSSTAQCSFSPPPSPSCAVVLDS